MIPRIEVHIVGDENVSFAGRVISFDVLLEDGAEEAIARAATCGLIQIPAMLRDEIIGTINALIDKGNHGMKADEMIENGSIEIGRGGTL